MRVIFAGTPEAAVPSLRELIDSPRHEVIAVVTRPDAAAGRGRKTGRSPVGRLADEEGIEVLTPARAADPDFLARLGELEPDCCPVVAYGNLLPADALAVPAHGWVNLHFSLLPAWRGAAPVQAAIAAGDEMTGAATFLIEPALDTGPVYGVVTERIRDDDTAGDLLERLAGSGARLLAATMDGIEDGTLTAVPQSADGVTYAEKITVEGARVQWRHPAPAVDRRVRSVTPDPGAWTMLGDVRLKLGPVRPAGGREPAPGQVEVTKKAVFVGTGTDAVELSWVQPPGKKQMRAADWARGARLTGEETFA
ncbi:methionyl-tRNA formyltransferase [Tomitella fengzijianii]|uniref:methionyl-tRNA formyltransferase n=1 Tax=Tomitella fengzijianii TaxID=2597660 RepID=UPI00131B84BC|nr:methionyl-tRNA formyltransferase [Tomitella fengzijianii]